MTRHAMRATLLVSAALAMTACANMNQRDRNTVTGGAVSTAGAAGGGVIGNNVGRV